MKTSCAFIAMILAISITICGTNQKQDQTNPLIDFDEPTATNTIDDTTPGELTTDSEESTTTNLIGAMTPEQALEYMKTTENLIIVETRQPQYIRGGFTGALFIPHTEMAERYDEIPENCPVILHCGGGVVVPGAYRILIKKRPGIPELSYIAGSPLFDDYNLWLQENK